MTELEFKRRLGKIEQSIEKHLNNDSFNLKKCLIYFSKELDSEEKVLNFFKVAVLYDYTNQINLIGEIQEMLDIELKINKFIDGFAKDKILQFYYKVLSENKVN